MSATPLTFWLGVEWRGIVDDCLCCCEIGDGLRMINQPIVVVQDKRNELAYSSFTHQSVSLLSNGFRLSFCLVSLFFWWWLYRNGFR